MDARELIDTITAAFPLQPVPEDGLQRIHAADSLYLRKITEQQYHAAAALDAGRTWLQYADEELANLDAAMSHLVVESFIYYLPAYLCAAVRHVSPDDNDPWSIFLCNTCFYVTHHKSDRSRALPATLRAATKSRRPVPGVHGDPCRPARVRPGAQISGSFLAKPQVTVN